MRVLGLRRLVLLVVLGFPVAARGSTDLSVPDRVRAQESIARLYFSHQEGSRRTFEQAVPREALEKDVATYLAESAALGEYWNNPITEEMLRRETERMQRDSRAPGRLRELFAALGDDAFLIQETLVRQPPYPSLRPPFDVDR